MMMCSHVQSRLNSGPAIHLLPKREEDDEDGRPPKVRQERCAEEHCEVGQKPGARRSTGWMSKSCMIGVCVWYGTHTAALSAGIHASQKKNAASMNMEMIKGARTRAEDHPSSDPLVMAKMKRMSATGQVTS